MIWVVVVLTLFVLLIVWILLVVIEIQIDTRIPEASITLKSLGGLRLWYDQHWFAQFRITYFRKTINLNARKPRRSKSVSHRAKKKPSRLQFRKLLEIIRRVLRSFRVQECNIYLDTGDHTYNARLYFLNSMPNFSGHMHVNFNGANYVVLKLKNRLLNLLVAFIKGYYS